MLYPLSLLLMLYLRCFCYFLLWLFLLDFFFHYYWYAISLFWFLFLPPPFITLYMIFCWFSWHAWCHYADCFAAAFSFRLFLSLCRYWCLIYAIIILLIFCAMLMLLMLPFFFMCHADICWLRFRALMLMLLTLIDAFLHIIAAYFSRLLRFSSFTFFFISSIFSISFVRHAIDAITPSRFRFLAIFFFHWFHFFFIIILRHYSAIGYYAITLFCCHYFLSAEAPLFMLLLLLVDVYDAVAADCRFIFIDLFLSWYDVFFRYFIAYFIMFCFRADIAYSFSSAANGHDDFDFAADFWFDYAFAAAFSIDFAYAMLLMRFLSCFLRWFLSFFSAAAMLLLSPYCFSTLFRFLLSLSLSAAMLSLYAFRFLSSIFISAFTFSRLFGAADFAYWWLFSPFAIIYFHFVCRFHIDYYWWYWWCHCLLFTPFYFAMLSPYFRHWCWCWFSMMMPFSAFDSCFRWLFHWLLLLYFISFHAAIFSFSPCRLISLLWCRRLMTPCRDITAAHARRATHWAMPPCQRHVDDDAAARRFFDAAIRALAVKALLVACHSDVDATIKLRCCADATPDAMMRQRAPMRAFTPQILRRGAFIALLCCLHALRAIHDAVYLPAFAIMMLWCCHFHADIIISRCCFHAAAFLFAIDFYAFYV